MLRAPSAWAIDDRLPPHPAQCARARSSSRPRSIVANAIILEAFVSFLNFGIRNTDISWGTALSASQGQLILGNWWWAFFPGMAIAFMVIGINFMGDGLRDAFDPRAHD